MFRRTRQQAEDYLNEMGRRSDANSLPPQQQPLGVSFRRERQPGDSVSNPALRQLSPEQCRRLVELARTGQLGPLYARDGSLRPEILQRLRQETEE
ncbi:hypothetical protein [Tropicimonas aquimaris]|uniref:Uncharacterized protein n=1 Tax=Tropicimonas aquimaris TaxID=914152 RepID=A0ABW3IMY5_9RHOB